MHTLANLYMLSSKQAIKGLPFLQGMTSFILEAPMELHGYGTATLESVFILLISEMKLGL